MQKHNASIEKSKQFVAWAAIYVVIHFWKYTPLEVAKTFYGVMLTWTSALVMPQGGPVLDFNPMVDAASQSFRKNAKARGLIPGKFWDSRI